MCRRCTRNAPRCVSALVCFNQGSTETAISSNSDPFVRHASLPPPQYKCHPGTFSETGLGETDAPCTICPAGQYTEPDAHGSTSCASCPAGTFLSDDATDIVTHIGSCSCTPCPVGTYSTAESSPSCTNCVNGKYNPEIQKGEDCKDKIYQNMSRLRGQSPHH